MMQIGGAGNKIEFDAKAGIGWGWQVAQDEPNADRS